jgi:hypothetical protein
MPTRRVDMWLQCSYSTTLTLLITQNALLQCQVIRQDDAIPWTERSVVG